MDAGFNIGVTASREHVDVVTMSLIDLMTTARETGMDQETVRAAFSTLAHTVKVENVTIQNCQVTGDKHLTVDMEGETSE